MSNEPVVLDASALLAFLQDEPGADVVAQHLSEAVISAVNLSEVATKLLERGVDPDDLHAALAGLSLDVRPFDEQAAFAAAKLRAPTRAAGLSFGDRACLALGQQLGALTLSADRAWGGLPDVPVRVRVVR